MTETRNSSSGPEDRTGADNIRRRYPVIALLIVTYFLTYLDRAVMATTIPFIARDFHLSSVAQGSVLSAFFFGYALMQIPSGILADRIGPARLLVGAVLCWSLFTALTGLVQTLAMLIAVRLLFGFSEGPAPTAVSKTVALWVPRAQIGRTNGIVLAATLLGSAAGPSFVTAIVLHWGWRATFLLLLGPGLLLALTIYAVLGRARPLAPVQPEGSGQAPAASWRSVLGSAQIRWCVAANFLGGGANWGLQNWLPSYLLKARHFGVAQMGIFATLPFLAAALGYMLGGYVADRFFARRRHVLIALCMFVASFSTIAAALAPTGLLAVAFMAAAFLLLGMGLATLFTMPLLLVPLDLVATTFGTTNTAAQVAGFLTPMLIGAVLDATGQNFAIVLILMSALMLGAAIAASQIGGGAPLRTHHPAAARPTPASSL